MSYVATVVVLVSPYEDRRRIEQACQPFGGRQDNLVCASGGEPTIKDQVWGGTKYPETHVLLGAFNHLDREALVAHLKATLAEPFTVCIAEEGSPWQFQTLSADRLPT